MPLPEDAPERIQVDWASLKEKNDDLVAWILIPALSISYPVLQGEDTFLRKWNKQDGAPQLPQAAPTHRSSLRLLQLLQCAPDHKRCDHECQRVGDRHGIKDAVKTKENRKQECEAHAEHHFSDHGNCG